MKNEHNHSHSLDNHSHGVEGLSCGCEHCAAKAEEVINSTESVFCAFKFDFIKIFISAILIIAACFISSEVLQLILFICAALVCGFELIINCVKNICKGKIFDENLLMAIASVTAFILGEYFEGAFIVTLFSFGEMLEGIATGSSRKKIAGLASLKSTVVHLIDKTGIKDAKPEDVEVGSFIEVRKGERVAIDGFLMGAPVELDVKAITGESKLALVRNGETVFSGAINVGDAFVIKTKKLYKDSNVERIIQLVEGATSKKAKSQKFISAFAKVYTPIVLFLAAIIAFVVPLFDNMNFVKWIYKSLSFLVVSCPCALVISVPLAFFVGIGALAKNGVLVKGSNFIEKLAKSSVFVFDKTGTLTKGEFEIDEVRTFNGFSCEEILKLIYPLEIKSNHPISKVIVNSIEKSEYIASGVSEIAGCGMIGSIDGKSILVGNELLLQENNIEIVKSEYFGTQIFVAVDGKHAASILLKDAVKPNSVLAVNKLKKLGVKKTYMLSGDNVVVANEVGKSVGIDDVFAQLLPEDKLKTFKEISKDEKGIKVYVGDGINDSPTLAASDVGVAMGGMGSEIAMESADVIIMNDDLIKLPFAVKYSKKIKSVVTFNIVFSIAVKVLIMLSSVIFSVPIWLAMFGDVGVMIFAVINSLCCSINKDK
ncbi:MAG: cadmium-translocating P-type ATPase [Clostridiales bacterium]|nr:cadmium-translocating P-type ATPase [Clostridiales bacterium]